MRYRIDCRDELGLTSGEPYRKWTRWGARRCARHLSERVQGVIVIAKGSTGPEIEWWQASRRTHPTELAQYDDV